MSFLRVSILLVAFIATVHGQFNLGAYNLRFAAPLNFNVNYQSQSNSNSQSYQLTSTMINVQNKIRSLACSTSNHDPCNQGGNNQKSCEAASCWWQVNSVPSYGPGCYKYGSPAIVTRSLMRQYRFTLPGYTTYQQKYNALKQYVGCTLSKPKTVYIKGIQDCQRTTYVPVQQIVHVPQVVPVSRCYWNGWTAFGPCSSSCSQGVKIRTRQCQGGVAGQGACIGPQQQSIVCQTSVQLYSAFGAWSKCSASCGKGYQTRISYSKCGQGNKIERKLCSIQSCCGKLNWSHWSQCSKTCGKGIQKRYRSDKCSYIAAEQQTKVCQNNNPGYSVFSSWSKCSVSCGNGYQTKIAYSKCGQASKVERKSCAMPSCCGKLNWSSWSPCSVTCGKGIQKRVRYDKCAYIGALQQTKVAKLFYQGLQ